MRKLEKLEIENFKSIRRQTLELGDLNVLIGANGAGKSNLMQVFRLLREIRMQNLARYSLERGAEALLYRGRKVSPAMRLAVEFGEKGRRDGYRLALIPTDENTLAVDRGTVYAHDPQCENGLSTIELGGASREARLAVSEERIAETIRTDLASYRLYHFHDTSATAALRGPAEVNDNRFLRSDAGNLAAFLYGLQQAHPEHFRNIQDVFGQIAPYFGGFCLAPVKINPDKIRLEWREKGSDSYFNGVALSDGSLRFLCLVTLLLQPELPAIILLDEPELGLHPAAIGLLAELLTAASTRTQLLVATQSVTLVNHLEPEQVWTSERENGESVFRRLVKSDLRTWLESFAGAEGYGLGDLWEKNLLGARP
ncbi:MAG: AAA family ATPase [Lentisphaerae bacterium]|nr:AAA family ATPase [Lentisphaerota bacterium]